MQIAKNRKEKLFRDNNRYTLALCQFQLEVYTRVGRVLEIAPNPCWASSWVSTLITMIIKKIKYPVLIYNHSYQKFKYRGFDIRPQLTKNKITGYYI
jgi:hypothetical protein